MSIDKQYIKGFNHGYLIAKHDPELAKKVIKPDNNRTEYLKGLISGKQEYRLEKTLGLSKKQAPQQAKKITKGRSK